MIYYTEKSEIKSTAEGGLVTMLEDIREREKGAPNFPKKRP